MTFARDDGLRRRSGLFSWAMVLLAVSVVFGGAPQENSLRLALVELASLPLVALAIRRLILTGVWQGKVLPLLLLGVVIRAALHAQMDRVSHFTFGGLAHEPAYRRAARLAARLPAELEHVFFVSASTQTDSGSSRRAFMCSTASKNSLLKS